MTFGAATVSVVVALAAALVVLVVGHCRLEDLARQRIDQHRVTLTVLEHFNLERDGAVLGPQFRCDGRQRPSWGQQSLCDLWDGAASAVPGAAFGNTAAVRPGSTGALPVGQGLRSPRIP